MILWCFTYDKLILKIKNRKLVNKIASKKYIPPYSIDDLRPPSSKVEIITKKWVEETYNCKTFKNPNKDGSSENWTALEKENSNYFEAMEGKTLEKLVLEIENVINPNW